MKCSATGREQMRGAPALALVPALRAEPPRRRAALTPGRQQRLAYKTDRHQRRDLQSRCSKVGERDEKSGKERHAIRSRANVVPETDAAPYGHITLVRLHPVLLDCELFPRQAPFSAPFGPPSSY